MGYIYVDQKFEDLLLFCRINNKTIIACELQKIQAELNELPPGLIPEILPDFDGDKLASTYFSLKLYFETSRNSAHVIFKFDSIQSIVGSNEIIVFGYFFYRITRVAI